jgi:hypothetical protein
VAQVRECRCASLPEEWGRCGEVTKQTWSPGCDGRMLKRALDHLGCRTWFELLGFSSTAEFIDWAVSQPIGKPDLPPRMP